MVDTIVKSPYLKDLAHRGWIQGLTLSSSSSPVPSSSSSTSDGSPSPDPGSGSANAPRVLCHYFGGVRYALPPTQRWRRARPLPADFRYGTREDPGLCTGGTGVCPQVGAARVVERMRRGRDGLRPKPKKKDGMGLRRGKGVQGEGVSDEEDCFQVNVWVPAGEAPEGGWPVFFFIHGGFLQFGSPNTYSLAALLGETAFQCVVVMPAYRLGVLGFLFSEEIQSDAASAAEEGAGNQGFWDQRLALEWTRENIALFGGDPARVTVAGYSAGAYSAFHQLAHDLYLPDSRAIIKQAVMWSNGPGMPKSASDAQAQFDELLSALNIPLSLSASEKLARLRALPARDLLTAGSRIKMHQFRPVITSTDRAGSSFIPPTLFQDINSGTFARKLASRKTRLLLGECRDEHFVYARWRPPPQNTLSSLRARLEADYPAPAVDALVNLYFPEGKLPAGWKDWKDDAFGRVYADMQVHMLQRGLIRAIATAGGGAAADGGNNYEAKGGAGKSIYRYRIEFRVKCIDAVVPPAWGVTHGTDQAIWFWGNGGVLLPEEKKVVKTAFIEPLVKFVNGGNSGAGEDIGWGTHGPREMRRLRPDGKVDIWRDEMWDRGARVWDTLSAVWGSMGTVDAQSVGGGDGADTWSRSGRRESKL